ncbi:MAG: AAA family ATPase, partial [Thermodesulfobacteriota bacterium]
RGKVETIKALELEVPENERELARKSADSFFKLALKYALFGSRPVIVVTFGLIGTGKSTIANVLSEELSFDIISSDIMRKRNSGISEFERKYEDYDTGIYSKNDTKKTYEEIFNNTEAHINNGKSVIIDASFSKIKWRKSISELTERLGIPLCFIKTQAPTNVIEQRLTTREKQEKTISDGRLDILDRFIADFEEPLEISKHSLITIDSTKPVLENIDIILNEILNRNLS